MKTKLTIKQRIQFWVIAKYWSYRIRKADRELASSINELRHMLEDQKHK